MLQLRLFLTLGFVALTAQASFAVSGSSTDPFEGATVNTDSGTIGGFPAAALFNATGGGSGEDGSTTIFAGSGLQYVEFTTAASVTISGVQLYNESDGGTEDGFRGISNFSLLADTDNNGSFETGLVANQNPTDDGLPDTYSFAAITATHFRAEFTGNGPRIRELDAVAPEPATFGLLSAATLVACTRRRRA